MHTHHASRFDTIPDDVLVDAHDRLHSTLETGELIHDQTFVRELRRVHESYRLEMLQRGISHPRLDDLDDRLRETEDDSSGHTPAKEIHHGIMLAFYPPDDIAQRIAIDGGDDPEELHLTLAYLGHVEDWPAEQLSQLPGLVSVYAANSMPMAGQISGMGRFAASPQSGSQDVLYQSVDLPDLPRWRQGLIDWLEDAGFSRPSEHGYVPHITLRYLPPEEPVELAGLETIPVEFTELVCKIGPKSYTFPLASLQSMRPSTWADRLTAHQETLHESRSVFHPNSRRSVQDDRGRGFIPGGPGVGAYRPDQVATLQLAKGLDDAPIIYGVLLVPDVPDLEGDAFSSEVIARACEKFKRDIEVDEEHKYNNEQLRVVDSFLAPEDYSIDGNEVKAGSWVVGIKAMDPEVIRKIKSGEFRGLSIDGTAMVRGQMT